MFFLLVLRSWDNFGRDPDLRISTTELWIRILVPDPNCTIPFGHSFQWRKGVLLIMLRIRDIFGTNPDSRNSTTDLRIWIWFRIRIWFRIWIFILLVLWTCDILVGIRIRGSVPLTYGSGFCSGSGLSRTNFDTPSVDLELQNYSVSS